MVTAGANQVSGSLMIYSLSNSIETSFGMSEAYNYSVTGMYMAHEQAS